MICEQKRIEYRSGQVIRIRPLADVHDGNTHCDIKAFKKFLSEDPESYFIGLGDLCDAIINKDIRRYKASSDAIKTDDIIDQEVERMVDILMPYKDRILGLGDGNHEESILKYCGSNITNRICTALSVPYLGYSWLYSINFSCNGGAGRRVTIRGHHGWGGGSRTQGADLTKFSRDMQYWDADIFIYGHVHRKQSDRVPRMGMVGKRLISKPKLLGICGTFLKTFSETADSTYSEVRGYPPAEIGGLIINIKPQTNSWCEYWIDT